MPIDVTKTQARWGEPTDFHIVGSDASGIVYAVGSDVTNVAVGDPITVHVQLSGRGGLDTLTLPEQPAWRDFRCYATSGGEVVDFGKVGDLQGRTGAE